MMNQQKNKDATYIVVKNLFLLCALGLLVLACQREEPSTPKDIPAFSLNLDLDGGVQTSLYGEEVEPLALTKSDEEIRAASINLKRDDSRKFKVELELKSEKGGDILPVVVACRRTEGENKRMFIGQTTMNLLKDDHGKPNRKFRIKKSKVEFFEINTDGSKQSGTQSLPEVNDNASYKVKLFVGAGIKELETANGGKRYTIGYGLDDTANEAQIIEAGNNGTVEFLNIQGRVPFTSDWASVEFGHSRENNETGLNSSEKTDKIILRAEGSILMFTLRNTMRESTLQINSMHLYSERLTTNIGYYYDAPKGELLTRPLAHLKKEATETEKYLSGSIKQSFILAPQGGEKSFFFWAKPLGTEYIPKEEWTPTSLIARIKETQKNGKEYWYNQSLIKLYDPLSKVRERYVTKTEIDLEDGSAVHPMNLMAHRYAWHMNTSNHYADTRAEWRGGNFFWASAQYNNRPWNNYECYAVTFSTTNTQRWSEEGVTLPFGDINPKHPMEFVGKSKVDYTWRPSSMPQLAALFPVGLEEEDQKKTNVFEGNPAIIREWAQFEKYQPDEDFYSIIWRYSTMTYAIRFLRKFGNNYYMTPYTAAYRYDRVGPWDEYTTGKYITGTAAHQTSKVVIRMRQLGSIIYQYSEDDPGYYSPLFSEERLRKLFDIVREHATSSVLTHSNWWSDSPMRRDDLIREYPAIGMWKGAGGAGGALWHVGEMIFLRTYDRTDGHYKFSYGKIGDFAFTRSKDEDFCPIILLAERDILQ